MNTVIGAETLFDNATEGIILTNATGEMVRVNPAAEKMFGYEKGALTGKKIELLIPKELARQHRKYRAEFNEHPRARGMGSGMELHAQRKDGSRFPVEISLSPFESDRGRYVIAFIIDITVRKKNEAVLEAQKLELEKYSGQIKQMNQDLERKVEDRTTMLRETLAQLEKSKDELAEALEREKELGDLKSRFVSTVSHEFRTPLSTIISSAGLIGKYQNADEVEKRERHINKIKDSVKHMNAMLEDLLSLGKLEEGLIKPVLEEFECASFMENFIGEMQEIARKGQKITLQHPKGTTVVCSDKRLLKNILINLVSNACKFSGEGAEIRISCKQSKNKLSISVQDAGIGISKEDREHLFERFFRARNASNIEGTGLGLHIVSKYLELLKGKIYLHSDIGKGSIFTIEIPTTKSDKG
ncbi:MAG TPA: PAS domain-containing sensor histidine kinase [Chitinophagales bacterium]|nr:PAS domain-containing sensor histidine kinase [Chitinophagales bacterium]